MICDICPMFCDIPEGARGKCRIRENHNGEIRIAEDFPITTAVVGPIEQKPFFHFYPGSKCLSVGFSGCNLFCKFCQNFSISQVSRAGVKIEDPDLISMALSRGAKTIAFTYSEPIVCIERVIEIAKLARAAGLKVAVKTNGYANEEPFIKMCAAVDAVNVDIKGTAPAYRNICGIDLPNKYDEWSIMRNLRTAATKCHLEIALLLTPAADDPDEVERLLDATRDWAGDHPIHILKFVPDFKLATTPAASMEWIDSLVVGVARRFSRVYRSYPGAVNSTQCLRCGGSILIREGINVLSNNLNGNICRFCSEAQDIIV